MSGLRGDWKRALLDFALVAMETAWVSPWFLFAIRPFAPRHPAAPLGLAVFGTLLLIALLVKGMNRLNVAPRAVSLLVMALGLLSGLAAVRLHLYPAGLSASAWLAQFARRMAGISEAIPADLVLLLMVFFLWWRGLTLGNREHTFERIGFSFRAGIALLMWNAALAALVGWRVPILGFAVAFFFFGLLAVGVGRVHDLELQPESGGKVSTPFWLASTLGAIAAVLFLAVIASQLLTVGNISAVMRALAPLWRILEAVALLVAQALAWLLQPLLEWLVRFFQAHIPAEFTGGTPAPEATPEFLPQTPAPPPPYLDVLKYAVVGLFVLGVLALVAFSVRRARAIAAASGRQEEREFVRDTAPPAPGLLNALRAGWNRLGDWLNLVGQFGLGERFRAAASIRWIYANLLRWAAGMGHPRKAWQTPYEFLQALTPAFPELGSELQAITEAYVRSHYGELPESEGELQRIRSCWERILNSQQAGGEG
ncbi:MAG: DUF4129 domain-containing protein [Anaerolineae bacterium]|nr:DUF4129 domain-containing protein [Anaerolineae bacterium]